MRVAVPKITNWSSGNLTKDRKRGREETKQANPGIRQRRETKCGVMDPPFTLQEMRRAVGKSGLTSPGKDQICYMVFKHPGKQKEIQLLGIYNQIWEEGRIPTGWKEAVIIPIIKPGKDLTDPTSHRPSALTSQIGKVMERMITESRSLLSPYQSGFRKGRGTMDPVIHLKTEIKKA